MFVFDQNKRPINKRINTKEKNISPVTTYTLSKEEIDKLYPPKKETTLFDYMRRV